MELATSAEKLDHFQLTHLRGWISMPLIHSDDRGFFFLVYGSWNVNLANMILSSILICLFCRAFSQNHVCKIDRRMQIKPKTGFTQLFYLLSLDDIKLPNNFSWFCHCGTVVDVWFVETFAL